MNTLLLCFLLSSIASFSADKKVSQQDIQVYINDYKLFKTENITLFGDSIRTDYCLNQECTQYVSWQFNIREIAEIEVGNDEGSYFVKFTCTSGECIMPPRIGTIYPHKHDYSLYMKGKKEADHLLDLMKQYRK